MKLFMYSIISVTRMVAEFFENNKKYIFIAAIVVSILVIGYIVYSYWKSTKEVASNTIQHVDTAPHEFCTRDGTCYASIPTKEEQEQVEKFVASENDPEDDNAEPIESYSDASHGSDE